LFLAKRERPSGMAGLKFRVSGMIKASGSVTRYCYEILIALPQSPYGGLPKI
jgi:hypothetical protein